MVDNSGKVVIRSSQHGRSTGGSPYKIGPVHPLDGPEGVGLEIMNVGDDGLAEKTRLGDV